MPRMPRRPAGRVLRARRWNIPLAVHVHEDEDGQAQPGGAVAPDRTHRKLALEAALRQRLEFILTMASGKKDDNSILKISSRSKLSIA